MSPKTAVALLKKAGATPTLCRKLNAIALGEAIKAVIGGASPVAIVEAMVEATR